MVRFSLFIVFLCSNCVSRRKFRDVLSDTEVIAIAHSTRDPRKAAKRICDSALAKNSADNVSALVIRLDGESGFVKRTKPVKPRLQSLSKRAFSNSESSSQHTSATLTSQPSAIVEEESAPDDNDNDDDDERDLKRRRTEDL